MGNQKDILNLFTPGALRHINCRLAVDALPIAQLSNEGCLIHGDRQNPAPHVEDFNKGLDPGREAACIV